MSGAHSEDFSITLDSKLESMDRGEEIARQAAGRAGFDEDEQYRISLAVRECLINALQHGNRSDEKKKIGLDIDVTSGRIVVQVTDQGAGFDAGKIPDPRSDERLLATSGRGIFLMRTFMDEVEVRNGENGGTVVTMTKFCPVPNSTTGSEPEKER